MTSSSSYQAMYDDPAMDLVTISAFPHCSRLATNEQICGFELLRLAFFALKLRKLEQCYALTSTSEDEKTYAFRRTLLQHAIFQQVLRLVALGARVQALQLIRACRDQAQPPEYG